MHDDYYCLTYLPIFSHDLNQAYDYINDVLHNPDAADSLINAVEAAIEKRLQREGTAKRIRGKHITLLDRTGGRLCIRRTAGSP